VVQRPTEYGSVGDIHASDFASGENLARRSVQELLGARERSDSCLIFSRRIFDRASNEGARVERPLRRDRPLSPLARSASSTISFSCVAHRPVRPKPAFGDGASGKPAVVNHEFVAVGSMTDRSMTFCSSRTFPGRDMLSADQASAC